MLAGAKVWKKKKSDIEVWKNAYVTFKIYIYIYIKINKLKKKTLITTWGNIDSIQQYHSEQ